MGSPIPTDPGPQDIEGALRPDGFYDSAINTYDDWRLAGAFVARSLAAQFAQQADSVNIPGEVAVSWRDRVSTWLAQARAWEKEAADSSASPALTGLTVVNMIRERDRYDGEFRRRYRDWQSLP
jgi:hypothetical protein